MIWSMRGSSGLDSYLTASLPARIYFFISVTQHERLQKEKEEGQPT